MFVNLDFYFDPKSKLITITHPHKLKEFKKLVGTVASHSNLFAIRRYMALSPTYLFKDKPAKLIVGKITISSNQFITSCHEYFNITSRGLELGECEAYYPDYIDRVLADHLQNKEFCVATIKGDEGFHFIFSVKQKNLINQNIINGKAITCIPNSLMHIAAIIKTKGEVGNNFASLKHTGIFRG